MCIPISDKVAVSTSVYCWKGKDMQHNKIFMFVWSNSFSYFICRVPDKETKLVAFIIGPLIIFTVSRKKLSSALLMLGYKF